MTRGLVVALVLWFGGAASAQCLIGLAAVPCPMPAIRTVPVSSSAGLSTALAGARPGDAIVLAAGVYSGPVTTVVSGTQAAPIVVRGGAGTVLRPGYASSASAVNLNHGWYRLVGVTIEAGWHGIQVNGRNVAIEDVTVRDTGALGGQGVIVMASDVSVVRLTQSRAGLASSAPRLSHGLYVSDYYNRGVSRVTVMGSSLTSNGGAGIHVWNQSLTVRDVRIVGNTVTGNPLGVVLTNVVGAELVGNVVSPDGSPPSDAPYRLALWLDTVSGLRSTWNRFGGATCTPVRASNLSLAGLWWAANVWTFGPGCAAYDDAALNAGQANH